MTASGRGSGSASICWSEWRTKFAGWRIYLAARFRSPTSGVSWTRSIRLWIANHVWAAYLNEREVESSYWIMPTGSHYPQRDHPEEMAKVIRIALTGDVPDRATEDAFMWSYNRSRSPEDAVFVGHSDNRPMEFPDAVEYTPSGYNGTGAGSVEVEER